MVPVRVMFPRWLLSPHVRVVSTWAMIRTPWFISWITTTHVLLIPLVRSSRPNPVCLMWVVTILTLLGPPWSRCTYVHLSYWFPDHRDWLLLKMLTLMKSCLHRLLLSLCVRQCEWVICWWSMLRDRLSVWWLPLHRRSNRKLSTHSSNRGSNLGLPWKWIPSHFLSPPALQKRKENKKSVNTWGH